MQELKEAIGAYPEHCSRLVKLNTTVLDQLGENGNELDAAYDNLNLTTQSMDWKLKYSDRFTAPLGEG